MNKRRTADDLAREIAEEAEGLELYYEDLSSRQPMRRASDHLLAESVVNDKSANSSFNRKADASSSDLNWNDELQSSYQSFLDDHDKLVQTTGMKTGVWIEASEFSKGKPKQQVTSGEKT